MMIILRRFYRLADILSTWKKKKKLYFFIIFIRVYGIIHCL